MPLARAVCRRFERERIGVRIGGSSATTPHKPVE
jgi:hypothetical protein